MADRDTHSNKTPAKMDWEKAKRLLYQAEADILVNKPIPHYNKSSSTPDIIDMTIFGLILGIVSTCFMLAEPPPGVFRTIVTLTSMAGFLGGGRSRKPVMIRICQRICQRSRRNDFLGMNPFALSLRKY